MKVVRKDIMECVWRRALWEAKIRSIERKKKCPACNSTRLKNNEDPVETKKHKTKDIRSGEFYSRYCVRCEKYFDTKKPMAKICQNCKKPQGRRIYKPEKKKCKFCKEEFIATSSIQKYCAEKCRLLYNANIKPKEKGNNIDKIKNMIDNGSIEQNIKIR